MGVGFDKSEESGSDARAQWMTRRHRALGVEALPTQAGRLARLWAWLSGWTRWFITDEIRAQGSAAVARARALVLAAPVIVAVTLAPGLAELIDGVPTPADPVLLVVAALLFACTPVILRLSSSTNLAGGWMLFCGVVASLIPAYLQQGLDSILMVWFLLIPVLASFFMSARASLFFAGLSALAITGFWLLSGVEHAFPPEFQKVESPGFRWLNLMLALVVISAVGLFWEHAAKRAERERERLEAQMRHSQKLETVGMLAGGIAHDFNNILAAILGHASILEGEVDDPVVRRRVAAIVASSRRAAGLVEQMLAYAGRAQTRSGAVDLRRMVGEVVELVRPGLDHKTELVLELDADTPAIVGDPIQLQQVVMNLITNASEALEGRRGRVWIASRAVDAQTGRARGYLDGTCSEGLALIEVRDEGCGIDPEALEAIFDPFFTTKPSGHGLGLAAVIGIVRSHGGDIEVESKPGRGTCFRVLFPRPEAETLAEAEAESAAPRPRVRLPTMSDVQPKLEDRPPRRIIRERSGEPGYVLIVDDEEMVRELAAEVLERAGHRVLLARDGDEGLAVFEANADAIDLFVLDRTMPGRDGLELLAELRRQAPEVPAILSSGYAEETSSKRLRALGVDAVLHKPWAPRDLVGLVSELTTPASEADAPRSSSH